MQKNQDKWAEVVTVYHAEVCWVSRKKVLKEKLWKDVGKTPMTANFEDIALFNGNI